jgi:hypothetical protein
VASGCQLAPRSRVTLPPTTIEPSSHTVASSLAVRSAAVPLASPVALNT